MKKGYIRNIDDLGRIVIPIAIRKSLNIAVGEPFEITEQPGRKISIVPYRPKLADETTAMQNIADFFSAQHECNIYITDHNILIAKAGQNVTQLDPKQDDSVKKILETTETQPVFFPSNQQLCQPSRIIAPIVLNFATIGTLIMESTEASELTDKNIKTALLCANYIAKQSAQN